MFSLDRILEMYGSAALVFVVCVAIGALIDTVATRLVAARSQSHGWRVGHAISRAMRGLPTTVGVIIGAHLSLQGLPLRDDPAITVRKALTVISILLVTAFVARIVGKSVRALTEREGAMLPSSSIFVNLAMGIVWIIGLSAILAALGISIAPILTALGVGGLAVGLALQPTLENVFSGIQVLASRQIVPGDMIRLESGEEGTVLDVTWRNTTILKLNHDVVIVPNAIIGQSRITNFSSLDRRHAFGLSVPVPLSADFAEVEAVARAVAQEVIEANEGAIRDATPSVNFSSYDSPNAVLSINIEVSSYVKQYAVRSDLIKRLHAEFLEAGIDLPTTAIAIGDRNKP